MYATQTHTVPCWGTHGAIKLLINRRAAKTSNEKDRLQNRRGLVSRASRTCEGMRQLRVRCTTSWKPGANVAAQYLSPTHMIVEELTMPQVPDLDALEEDGAERADDEENEALDAVVQVGDDVVVLAPAHASDGPFWIARVLRIKSGQRTAATQLQIKWYELDGSADLSYKAGNVQLIEVPSVVGVARLQQEGDRYFLADSERDKWTSAVSRIRLAARRANSAASRRQAVADIRARDLQSDQEQGRNYGGYTPRPSSSRSR